MINHVVMFKLKAGRRDVAPEVVERLRSLPPRIPQIRSYSAGVNVVDDERAWDAALASTFDSFDDLRVYQVHPDHLEVVTFIREVAEQVATVDFES